MVREVTLGKDGQANGVVLHRQVPAQNRPCERRAWSCSRPAHCESVRILLNSKCALSAGSRELERQGRQVHHGHRGQRRSSGQIPLLENLPLHNEDGAEWRAYVLALVALQGTARRQARLSRAAITSNSAAAATMPGMGTGAGLEWLTGGSYGRKFKEDARRYYGSFVCFAGRGEMIPNEIATARSIRK